MESHDQQRNLARFGELVLADRQLQSALGKLKGGLVANRTKARAALPEFEDLREVAKTIKDHTLANLDLYLEAYEKNATAAPPDNRDRAGTWPATVHVAPDKARTTPHCSAIVVPTVAPQIVCWDI